MKVKFIGNHRFYKTAFKSGRELTPEEKEKYTYAYIPDGAIAEVVKIENNHLTAIYTEPDSGLKKHLMVCLNCFGDKVQLIEDEG
jgi:hypothetical protein